VKNLALLLSLLFSTSYAKFELSKSVYKDVPFSSQFSEDGALIRNVNYEAVNALIPQIETKYGVKLEDRGESHITVLTPPEAQGWFTKDKKGVNFLISTEELQFKYSRTLQDTDFEIKCVGQLSNDEGKHVFYLVVTSKDIEKVREEIQEELEQRAKFTGKATQFDKNKYYPHITIGYVKGDIHGPAKDKDTCENGDSIKWID
jgi:2'-5' RNA ligase